MADRGTPVYRYLVGDYLNVGTGDAPDYQLMCTFETLDESPTATTQSKHYTSDKNATTNTTGYQTQFAFNTDMYRNEVVSKYIRDIGEEQKLGVETDFVRVRLYEPIEGDANTFYARKFKVSFEISSLAGAGGEIMTADGNMNTIGDVVIGKFNTETKTFTATTA